MSAPLIDDVLPTDELRVTPWPDAVLDVIGHDPRSTYVEQYWLGILGPSTTWLLRRLAAGFEDRPEGFVLPLSDTAKSLGLGTKGGKHSPFVRALGRACTFRLAQMCDGDGLAVRRKLPPLTPQQVHRLPPPLRDAHQRWLEQQARTPDTEDRRRRARRLALSLLELGESTEATEHQLHRWRVHPALAHDAVRWAVERHSGIDIALTDDVTPPPTTRTIPVPLTPRPHPAGPPPRPPRPPLDAA